MQREFSKWFVTSAAVACAFAAGSPSEAASNLVPEVKFAVGQLHAVSSVESGTTSLVKIGINVWYPKAAGEFPVVVFVSGFNGLLPGLAYSDLLTALASRGVIVVAPEGAPLLPAQYKERSVEVAAVEMWLPKAFSSLFIGLDASEVPNAAWGSGFILAGHSSSGQAIVEAYRLDKAKVGGLLLLDPVDGAPFAGFPQVLPDGDKLVGAPPTLLLTTELCNQSGWNVEWFPPCCPARISAEHFYEATEGRKWWINVLDYGHVDMLDSVITVPVNLTGFCKASDPSFDKTIYRSYVAEMMAAFASHVVSGAAFPPVVTPEAGWPRTVLRSADH